MSFSADKAVALLISALLAGCASKPLDYKDAAQLSKIEEFDKLVQITDIKKDAEAKAEKKSKAKVPEQKIVAKKKKRKGKKHAKKEQRQPTWEDSEGFAGRRPVKDPFVVGEKVTMMMTYFGVSAGDMTLSVKPFVDVNGRKSYHFHVALHSSDLFSLFYLVDDWGETFVDYETLLPPSMAIGAKESKKLLALKSAFDFQKDKAYRWERAVYKGEGPQEKKKEWKISPFSQNVISAFWYIRTFRLTPGKTLNFRVADDGKNMNVKVEVLRRERIKTLKGEFNTVVLKPTVEIGGIFQPMGNVFFWLTDDDRKMFVRMEAEIKIGKVIGQLREIDWGKP
jgi:hypothetical protein